MRNLVATVTIVLLALSTWTFSAQACPPFTRCSPYVGTFERTSAGIVVTIVNDDDRQVATHTEQVANPPEGSEVDTLIKKGSVRFKAHIEKSGAYFIHWDTLQPAKS